MSDSFAFIFLEIRLSYGFSYLFRSNQAYPFWVVNPDVWVDTVIKAAVGKR